VLKITVEHRLNCSPDRHWELFWDPEWNQELIVKGLGFSACDCTEAVDKGDKRSRQMVVTPKLNVPAAVAKLLGPKMAYTEKGVFDKSTGKWTFDTILSVMADRIRLGGAVTMRDHGDNRSTRVTDLWVDVRIFGLGGVIERAAETNLRDGWAKSAEWINGWLKENPDSPSS